MRPLLLLAAALLTAPMTASGQVTLDGARWEAMQPGAGPVVSARATPSPVDRQITLSPSTSADGAPGLDVAATWTFGDGEPGWLDLRLVSASLFVREVTIDGVPAPVYPAADGAHVVAWIRPLAVISLRGTLPGEPTRAPQALSLLPAAAGLTSVRGAKGLVPEWSGGPAVHGALWGGAGDISLQLVPPREGSAAGLLVTAEVGLGVTITDDVEAVRASVRHLVRRGALEQVALDLPGAGADLSIEGPNVLRWERRGDRALVTLRTPAAHLVELAVAWTSSLPGGDEASLALPSVQPVAVSGVARTLQLARDGGIEVIPALRGWSATASSELPAWGRGLVTGAPTASFTGTPSASGALSVLRFVPVHGPEAVVDVADVLLATSRDGRVLMRARYEVRNDRAAALQIRVPRGARLLALRVGETAATVTWGQDGALRVPLRRSIESIGGMLSFPVELALLFDGEPWARRDLRTVPLPGLDAPIAVLRTTAHLPPGWTPLRASALPDHVPDFTRGEGITYGLAVSSEEDRQKVEKADALFGDAVRAWEDNDFTVAQGYLNELGALGAGNDNVLRLQGNLDLLSGDDDGDGAAATGQAAIQGRRVREQAKAKAADDEADYEEARRAAESSYRSGDYKKAEQEAERALELGNKLAVLEQEESGEVATRNARVSEVLKEARKEGEKKRKRASLASPVFKGTASGKTPSFKQYEPLALEPEPEPAPPPVDEPASGESVPEEPARDESVLGKDEPAVVATTRAVPIPAVGAALRFQTLLLPAGAAPTVTLRARAERSPQETR